ncbi:Uncharacterized protein TCM_030296 [Theobroma cacao]|uniref:Uncharacterized protein n=1 Tax=Theobroma cacao TaxID=3641 RepID=A0A061GNV5_THECC|nr:Uncharacterized protein TCM_030296 [Theobroma cacao]
MESFQIQSQKRERVCLLPMSSQLDILVNFRNSSQTPPASLNLPGQGARLRLSQSLAIPGHQGPASLNEKVANNGITGNNIFTFGRWIMTFFTSLVRVFHRCPFFSC